MVSYGHINCARSWDRIYLGYAMAPHQAGIGGVEVASGPICVDREPAPLGLIEFPNDVNTSGSLDYSFVRSTSAVFKSNNGLVPCVVCARN